MQWLQERRQELMEQWADGMFSAAFDMEMAVKNAGATGACSIIKSILEISYEELEDMERGE